MKWMLPQFEKQLAYMDEKYFVARNY